MNRAIGSIIKYPDVVKSSRGGRCSSVEGEMRARDKGRCDHSGVGKWLGDQARSAETFVGYCSFSDVDRLLAWRTGNRKILSSLSSGLSAGIVISVQGYHHSRMIHRPGISSPFLPGIQNHCISPVIAVCLCHRQIDGSVPHQPNGDSPPYWSGICITGELPHSRCLIRLGCKSAPKQLFPSAFQAFGSPRPFPISSPQTQSL